MYSKISRLSVFALVVLSGGLLVGCGGDGKSSKDDRKTAQEMLEGNGSKEDTKEEAKKADVVLLKVDVNGFANTVTLVIPETIKDARVAKDDEGRGENDLLSFTIGDLYFLGQPVAARYVKDTGDPMSAEEVITDKSEGFFEESIILAEGENENGMKYIAFREIGVGDDEYKLLVLKDDEEGTAHGFEITAEEVPRDTKLDNEVRSVLEPIAKTVDVEITTDGESGSFSQSS